MNTNTEERKSSQLFNRYKYYFNSRLIIFMLAILIFHILIIFYEIIYMFYTKYLLLSNRLPENNSYLLYLIDNNTKIFISQSKYVKKWIKKTIFLLISKLIDISVVFSFFSHPIREYLMKYSIRFKGIVRINNSHISIDDNNYLSISLLIISIKTVLIQWIISFKQDYLELFTNLFIQLVKYLLVCPIIIWLFSSVYNKTKYILIFSAYISITLLILISNCTGIIPDNLEGLERIPARDLGEKLFQELVRLKLEDRIFWDQSADTENAALVKTGSSRYIIVMGNMLKYGEKELISFLAHEIGHADDFSTEKKLLATIIGLGISCGSMVLILHLISDKYESKGVSRFSVVVFLLMSYIYVFSCLFNTFYNNLYILSEVNADLYAKRLGFGKDLAAGLYKLIVGNNSLLFHSAIYTHYAQDHPTVATRVGYLMK